MSADTLAVVRCAPRLRMCKLIRSSGEVVGYDLAKTVDIVEVGVDGLDSLRDRLRQLLGKPRCCVIRGALIDGPRATSIRRLVHADRETGAIATLNDVPRRWLALDMDGIDMPAGIAAADLPGCAEHVIGTLPAAFANARCLAQASASHGIKPGIRLRLWFWLTRATSGQELGVWLKGAPVDRSVFRPAQPIYTAAPLFEDGVDPIAQRIVELPGDEMVEVPAPVLLEPPPRKAAAALPDKDDARASQYAVRALTNAIYRITTAGEGNRHGTCIREAQGLGRLVDAGLLTTSQVRASLARALSDAGKDEAEGILAATWGLAHPRTGMLPEGLA